MISAQVTFNCAGGQYRVHDIHVDAGVAFLTRSDLNIRHPSFFGKVHLRADNIDHCQVTGNAGAGGPASVVGNNFAAGGFEVFRIRPNCVAIVETIDDPAKKNKNSSKTNLIKTTGVFVVPRVHVRKIHIYDLNNKKNYGDSQLKACYLDENQWVFWYTKKDLRRYQTFVRANKNRAACEIDRAADLMPHKDGKGLYVIVDPETFFDTADPDIGKWNTPQIYTTHLDPKNDAYRFHFLFHAGRPWGFEMHRFIVPTGWEAYFILHFDPCEIVRTKLTTADVVTLGSSVCSQKKDDDDDDDAPTTTMVKKKLGLRDDAAFIRCADGLCFYNEDDDEKIVVVESLAEPEKFDRELQPTTRPERLKERELERISQLVGRQYYKMSDVQRIAGKARTVRDMVCDPAKVKVTMNDKLVKPNAYVEIDQFKIFEIPQNHLAIVGARRTAQTYHRGVDDDERLDGLVQYFSGFVLVDNESTTYFGM